MLALVHILNQDRKNLQHLASNLLSIISQGEISRSPFEKFISRTQHIHYQLQKKFLERERKHSEELEKELMLIKTKEKKEISTQTEENKRTSISNISDIQFAMDFSIASDTTTSPLNSSIDIYRNRNSDVFAGAITDRSAKKPSTRMSISGLKVTKKNTEDCKQLPVRKTIPRKTAKN